MQLRRDIPAYWIEITGADVEEAMRTAEQTLSWAKEILLENEKDL